MAEPLVVACRASEDYQLHVRFSDGIAGSVYLGNLLEIGAFQLWRDVRRFLEARVDPLRHAIVCPAGVRLDADVLRWDILARAGCTDANEARRVVKGIIARDADFQRFMYCATREQDGPVGPVRCVLRAAGLSETAKRTWARRKMKRFRK